MKYNAPISDYIVKSTFPLAAEIAALEGSSIDFVHKSTFLLQQTFNFHDGLNCDVNLEGMGINAANERADCLFKILPSGFTLTNIDAVLYVVTDPCNVQLRIRAAAVGEAIGTHSYGWTVISANSPYGASAWFTIDIYSYLGAISNDDIVGVSFLYSATAPVTNLRVHSIVCKYTIT